MKILSTKIFLFTILTAGLFLTNSANCVAEQNVVEPILTQTFVQVKNQKIQQVLPDAYLVEWETSVPTTGKVFYGVSSVDSQGVNEQSYNYSTIETKSATTTHSVAVWGLDPAREYYLRPVSSIVGGDGSEPVAYGDEWAPNTESPIPGYVSGECNYITEYLKYGEDNSFVEVMKLQQFLRDREGYLDIVPTGIFDEITLKRTKEFQMNHKEDILFPWGVDIPTGYVYITTTKKINELYCGREFELSSEHTELMPSSSSEITKLMDELMFIPNNNGKIPPLTDFDIGVPPSPFWEEIIPNSENIGILEPDDNTFGDNLDLEYLNEDFVDKSFVVDGEIAEGKSEEQEGVVFRILSSISSAVRKIVDWF
ncbi:peptidoglycan-binding domain-containing protein [Patescibacteria group bacterium]